MALQGELNLYFLGTVSLLGLKHGLDLDHIAAIADVTGGDLVLQKERPKRLSWLPACYASGHFLSVIALSLMARFVTAQFPEWLDPLMEKIVGATLLSLGGWLAVSIALDLIQRRPVRFTGRGSLLVEFCNRSFDRIAGGGRQQRHALSTGAIQPRTAFSLGVIHGFGAETGTQVALLTTVCGGTVPAAICVVLAFGCGLIVSTLAVGITICGGMAGVAQIRALSAAFGFLTALVSIAVGCCLMLGHSSRLPSLSDLSDWGFSKC